MAGEDEVLAEVERIVDDRAEVELQRELATALAGVDGLLARAEAIQVMRHSKGKAMAPASLESGSRTRASMSASHQTTSGSRPTRAWRSSSSPTPRSSRIRASSS